VDDDCSNGDLSCPIPPAPVEEIDDSSSSSDSEPSSSTSSSSSSNSENQVLPESASSTKCGNNICEKGETTSSCPSDCTAFNQTICGDKICSKFENPESCPGDCSSCGDGICSSSESPVSCSEDCIQTNHIPFGNQGEMLMIFIILTLFGVGAVVLSVFLKQK
jgi:hypothetical protein